MDSKYNCLKLPSYGKEVVKNTQDQKISKYSSLNQGHLKSQNISFLQNQSKMDLLELENFIKQEEEE